MVVHGAAPLAGGAAPETAPVQFLAAEEASPRIDVTAVNETIDAASHPQAVWCALA
jgi:hypothetical protein